jgi:hypothetical protein
MISAVSFAKDNLGKAMKWVALENRSMATRIVVLGMEVTL